MLVVPVTQQPSEQMTDDVTDGASLAAAADSQRGNASSPVSEVVFDLILATNPV